jgi:hypothetical protein
VATATQTHPSTNQQQESKMTTEVTLPQPDHSTADAQTQTTASNAESDRHDFRALGPRPHGHVVGHGLGDPPSASLDGRPRGHVVGHRIGDPAPASLDRRPHGHIVGHGSVRTSRGGPANLTQTIGKAIARNDLRVDRIIYVVVLDLLLRGPRGCDAQMRKVRAGFYRRTGAP